MTNEPTPYAVISEDGRYRYRLYREWSRGPGTLLWVMLNPSTADAEKDDATIRRCREFARSWGYSRMYVGNLFAYRETAPEKVWAAERAGTDIVGPHNDAHLQALVQLVDHVVVAWGAMAAWAPERVAHVTSLIYDGKRGMTALGITRSGHPCHPLRLAASLEPQPWFNLVMERAAEVAQQANDDASVSVRLLSQNMQKLEGLA